MKKTVYLAPAIKFEEMDLESLMNTVSNVNGNAGVTMGDENNPTAPRPIEGDSRQDIWADDEEDIF